MPGHFQSGMAGGILDAVLADAELIHSGNAVEAEFMGRMIGDLTIFTVFPKVFIELVGGDGKLGVSATVQNVFLMAVDLPQLLYHVHCFFCKAMVRLPWLFPLLVQCLSKSDLFLSPFFFWIISCQIFISPVSGL